MAGSVTSCWPIRNATATSGNPAGASGMNRLPRPPTTAVPMTTVPAPKRRLSRGASRAREQRAEPAHGRDQADRRGIQPELVEGQQVPGRPEDSPHRRGRHRRQGRARAGSDCGSRAAAPRRSLCSTGSRSDLGGGGGSFVRTEPISSAEMTNVTASMRMAIGPVRIWTRNPAAPNAANSRHGATTRRGRRWLGPGPGAARSSAGTPCRRRRRTS